MKRSIPLASALLCILAFAGCGSMSPLKFDGGTPEFNPMSFFEGPVRSWGVIENGRGNPRKRFRVDVDGKREGEVLTVTQHFFYEGGRREQRVWHIRQAGPHRFEATANDVVGTSVGESHGNAFIWEYTLALHPGNPLLNVRMHHWMYLQGDGTMTNRVRVTKFGIPLSHITEHFQRGASEVSSIGP